MSHFQASIFQSNPLSNARAAYWAAYIGRAYPDSPSIIVRFFHGFLVALLALPAELFTLLKAIFSNAADVDFHQEIALLKAGRELKTATSPEKMPTTKTKAEATPNAPKSSEPSSEATPTTDKSSELSLQEKPTVQSNPGPEAEDDLQVFGGPSIPEALASLSDGAGPTKSKEEMRRRVLHASYQKHLELMEEARQKHLLEEERLRRERRDYEDKNPVHPIVRQRREEMQEYLSQIISREFPLLAQIAPTTVKIAEPSSEATPTAVESSESSSAEVSAAVKSPEPSSEATPTLMDNCLSAKDHSSPVRPQPFLRNSP